MYQHGKFTSSRPGAVKSQGSKPPQQAPQHSSEKPMTPHGSGGEKHVTETHPGQTQPHPSTGVHAFMAQHKGGGKYQSHTHHDGGEVETKDHSSAGEMHQANQQALPDENQGQDQPPMDDQNGMGMEDVMSGIGGAE